MLAHRFPLTLGVGSIGRKSTFLSTFLLHIKLKGMTNAVTCKQIFCRYIVKFCLFHVLVLANNKWDLADNQFNLHGHADWSAIFVVRMQQSQPVCVAAHMFCIFSFFACKQARNGASNTKFVSTKSLMASIHWSSAQRRSQNAEKLWTSKGDYRIKQWFSTIASIFKWELLLKERICSQREQIFFL